MTIEDLFKIIQDKVSEEERYDIYYTMLEEYFDEKDFKGLQKKYDLFDDQFEMALEDLKEEYKLMRDD